MEVEQWPADVIAGKDPQLEKAIEEACQMARGSEIRVEDLPDTVRPASESRPQPATDPSRNT